MRSEGYSSRSVCLCVCVCVCVCVPLFSDYRLRGGLWAIQTASVLQEQEKNVAILLKRLRSRDIVKTSEKANMPRPSINCGHAYNN